MRRKWSAIGHDPISSDDHEQPLYFYLHTKFRAAVGVVRFKC